MATTPDQIEAARYLGMPESDAERIRPEVVAAVTGDHHDEIPADLVKAGLLELSDHDRDEILTFRRFLRAVGPARSPLAKAGGES